MTRFTGPLFLLAAFALSAWKPVDARPIPVIGMDIQRVQAEMKACRAQLDDLDREVMSSQTIPIGWGTRRNQVQACYDKLSKKLAELYRELRGGDPKDSRSPQATHAKETVERLQNEVRSALARLRAIQAKLNQLEAKSKRK
ncbi:MAG: hypothetical protein HY820_20180 [Acidobacteria bacterium]|nr:hypothetical protein [Acidobacteriota bacterium]